MIKNTLLALVAVASVGAAVPAFADTGAFGDRTSSEARELTPSTIVDPSAGSRASMPRRLKTGAA